MQGEGVVDTVRKVILYYLGEGRNEWGCLKMFAVYTNIL